MSKKLIVLFTVLALLAGCTVATAPTAAPQPTAAPEPTAVPQPTAAPELPTLILATTTSTADTGLLDYLDPQFEKVCNCQLDYIAVGTGQALEMGTKGDADVLLVHSRKSEDKFVADGDAKERFDVMYNDFVVVGPKADPAKIEGMTSSVEAFTAIADTEATFASRGDKSGTNSKELTIWSSAAITPTAEMTWYKSLGQGMGDTLLFSQEQQAYTLSDRGTWLSMKDKLPDLDILVGGDTLAENVDSKLLNPYGVMAVNPDKHPGVEYDLAMQFVQWILSDEVQTEIGQFGVDKFGGALFYPGTPPTTKPAAAPPALQITGSVATATGWAEAEVQAMTTLDTEFTNKKGETNTYTGVPLKDLLALASPAAGATTLVLVADDGYTTEIPLADALACADCIVAFQDGGGFRSVLPGFEGSAQVKGLIEIQVK